MALKVGQLYGELSLDDQKFRSGLEKSRSDFSSFGSGLLTKAAGLAAGIGAALGAVDFAKSTVAIGVAYQDQMNTLQAVSDATGEQMDALGKKAIELGNDLSLPSTSAKSAAEAMTELVKGGISVQDSMDAAKAVLQLAAAATVDEGKAATYVADALNTFHMAGTQAGMVADLLAGAANASSGEITDMGDSLQQSAAVFAAAKVPIYEVVTLIGELANNGIRGSDAGTSLKTMMLALQTPTAQQAGLMKQLNIHLYDSHGKMRSWVDIIKDAQDPLAKLTQAQRDQALGTIFGSDAVRSANIIFGSGIDKFNDMEFAITKEGSAAEVAAAKSKGLGGAWRGLQSELETFQLQLDQKAFPALEGFIRGLADLFPKAADAALNSLDTLSSAAGKVAGAVGKAAQDAAPSAQEATRVVGGWKDAFIDNMQKAVKGSGPQFDALKKDFADVEADAKKFSQSEAFAAIVATFAVLIPASFRPTLAGLQLMIDQFRIVSTGIMGLVQITYDLFMGDWKAAWQDAAATAKTQIENVNRYQADGAAFVKATQAATSDDVMREYNRMYQQTLNATRDFNENELAANNQARIALGQAAIESGHAYTAGLEDGMRAGGTRVEDAAQSVVKDGVAAGREEAKASPDVGAFVSQGIAAGVADNRGFISSAAVAATRNALDEARSKTDPSTVGAFLATGIALGLTNNQGFISNAAVAATRNAMKEANAANQSHSPSRLWAHMVGLPMAQGIALGVRQGMDAIAQAAIAVTAPLPTRSVAAPVAAEGASRDAGAPAARNFHLTVNGAQMQPIDERRLWGLFREMQLLHG